MNEKFVCFYCGGFDNPKYIGTLGIQCPMCQCYGCIANNDPCIPTIREWLGESTTVAQLRARVNELEKTQHLAGKVPESERLSSLVSRLQQRVAELEGAQYDYDRSRMYISRLEKRIAELEACITQKNSALLARDECVTGLIEIKEELRTELFEKITQIDVLSARIAKLATSPEQEGLTESAKRLFRGYNTTGPCAGNLYRDDEE